MMKQYTAYLLTLLLLLIAAVLPLSATAADTAPATADVVFTLDDTTGKPGDQVLLDIRIRCTAAVNSLALYNLEYDTEALTFLGFDNYSETEAMCLFGGGFDTETETVILALRKSTALDTVLGSIRFRINSGADSDAYKVTMTSAAKNNAEVFTSAVLAGTVTVTGETAPDTHTHVLKHTPASEPTCLYAGTIAHWTCSVCNQKFLDADGTREALRTVLPSDPNCHPGETVLRGQTDPTQTAEGYTGDILCTACGQILDYGTVIAAAGTPKTPWDNPFDDITEADRYYDSVRFVYENGLFLGTSDHEFSPELTMTRAMFVTVLGRLAGIEPDTYLDKIPSFDDVKPDQWYSPYIAWATEHQIILGRGDGTFGTNEEATVEQAAAILARYARFAGHSTETQLKLTHTDAASVSAWATDDIRWAVANRIYAGEGNKLSPLSAAKRALVADMLLRYTEAYN